MKKRYISVSDLAEIVYRELHHIDNLNIEIEHIEKRITYLNALRHYLVRSDFCPMIKRKIVDSDMLLQEFVTPILLNDKLKHYEFIDKTKSKDYGVDTNTINLLLTDFLKFVCNYKGHRIGVGDFLVSKFISERCK